MSRLLSILNSILITVNYTLLTSGTLLLLACCYTLYQLQQKNKRLRVKEKEASRSAEQLLQMETKYFKLLSEKEWLLKEVHHRVKNNLQLVISLLNMQTGYLKDEFALDAFGDIGSRIRAISLIHQRMYQEENYMAMVNIKDYVTELVTCLEAGPSPAKAQGSESTGKGQSGPPAAANIGFRLNVDPIELTVSQCVPLGLILNEAITNSMKYAFGGRQSPMILISLQQQTNGTVQLTIADNGKGLPENFDLENNASMGLQLIRMLSDQLEGDLNWKNQDGLLLSLKFARQLESSGAKPHFL